MHTQFKGTHYELAPEITQYAGKKIKGLMKYLGETAEYTRAYVDLGKETEAHQNGRIWHADITLETPGARFYAAATEESMEAAIDKVTAELASEVKTARDRQKSLMKRGGAAVKSLMQGFRS